MFLKFFNVYLNMILNMISELEGKMCIGNVYRNIIVSFFVLMMEVF